MDVFFAIHFTPFILACLFSELTPGPNMGYLTLVSAQHGRRTGLSMVVGICLGLLTMGLLSALGVGTLINHSTTAYNILRYAGTAYLFWLAYDAWRDARARKKTKTKKKRKTKQQKKKRKEKKRQ